MSGKNHGVNGVWSPNTVFRAWRLLENAAAEPFGTSEAKTVVPTRTLSTGVKPALFQRGFINRIHYRLNPANAVTFTVRIWSSGTATATYDLNLDLLYESPALQADDTDYDITELNIPFRLNRAGTIYYSIEWSGAAGNVAGFIEVSGEVYV